MPRRDRLDATAIAVMVLLCAVWGFQQTAVKLDMAGGIPPVLQATMRSAGAAALCWLWVGWRQGWRAANGLFRRDAFFWPGVALGLIFGVEFALIFVGVQLTSASRAVLFLYSAPFFTAAGAHFLVPGERLRPMQAVGLAIAFAGVGVAFADGLRGGGGDVLGDILSGLSGLLWAAGSIFIKISPGARGVSAARLLAVQLGGSVPVLVPCSWALGEWHALPHFAAFAWAMLAYQTVAVAFASYLAWFWLLVIYPAGRLSGFTFLTPLFGIVSGALFLGEPLTLSVLAGLAAIAAGLHLLNRPAPA